MEEQILYVLDIRARNVFAEFALNDVVISEIRGDAAVARQSVVNAFVVAGINTLVANVRPRGTGLPALNYRFFKTFRAPDASEEMLVTRVLPDATTIFPIDGSSITVAGETSIPQAFGPWAWEAPNVREFDAGRDQASALQFVRRVWEAFAQREEATLVNLMQLKMRELARALQLTPDALLDDAREHFRSLFAAPAWALRPLSPETIVFRPMAGRRLVAVVRRDGRPPIESAAGPPYKLEMMIANLLRNDGRSSWQVVR